MRWCGLILVVLVFNSSGEVGPFGQSVSYGVGDQPEEVLLCDIDQDGDLDAVTSDRVSDEVSVLLNMGDGVFLPRQRFDVGDHPSILVVSDFNRDGNLDIAVSSTSSISVLTVLLQDGSVEDGVGFLAPISVDYGINREVRGLAVLDLDEDSVPDLLANLRVDGGVHWLKGNGDGTFGSPVDVAPSATAGGIVVGDLNQDGSEDLITRTSGGFSVYLNDLAGGFESPVFYGTAGSVVDFELVDLNGDGHLDVFAAQYGPEMKVFLNVGNGALIAWQAFSFEEFSFSITAADVDHDGDKDIVAAAWVEDSGPGLFEILNNGNGEFFEHTQIGGGFGQQRYVEAGDLDLDGDDDVVVLEGLESIRVLTNSGDGYLEASLFYKGFGRVGGIQGAQIDGMRGDDVVYADPINSEVGLMLARDDGRLESPVRIPIPGRPSAVELVDVAGFGALDLLVACRQSDDVKLLVGNGAGGFSLLNSFDVGDYPVAMAVGDLDGDGDPDLVVANSGQGSTLEDGGISVLMNLGFWNFAPAINHFPGTGLTVVAVGDLDGQGGLEVIVPSGSILQIFPDVVDGILDDPILVPIAGGARDVLVRDMDLDGIQDLVIATSADTVLVLRGNGDGTFVELVSFDTPMTVRSVDVADLNDDGHLDIVVTASAATAAVYLGDGLGGYGSALEYRSDYSGADSSCIADLNMDGRPDLVTAGLGDDPLISTWFNNSTDAVECAADLNEDGALNFLDVSRFLTDQADFNGDGAFNFLDVSGFLTAYGAGCP